MNLVGIVVAFDALGQKLGEMQEMVGAMEAEIRRLRTENEDLKQRTEERAKT